MAETTETVEGIVNLSDGQSPNQNISLPEQPNVTTEDNIPLVSDINFEDVADIMGSPSGGLASLQFVDPVFEGMLMNAGRMINAAPPITGLHSINNPYPGKATQHYNPYESSTPPDITTEDGKAKFLAQGLYETLTNGKKEVAPGYTPDIQFGIRETNFDRYYAHPNYDKLGFHPFRNNEELYNANSTFWDDNARAWKQTSQSFWTGFTSSYDAAYDWMVGGDYLQPDRDGAFAFADAMRIGNSSKEGFGGAANRFMLNSGYTFGIIANIAAEEIALAVLTVATEGGAAPVAYARTAVNVGRAARAWSGFRTALKSGFMQRSRISAGAQLMKDLNKVENARHFFTAAGKGALNFVAPGTMKALQTLNTTKGVARGVQSVKNANALFGGFYRDAREINLAIAESKLESGLVYNQMINSLYHEYMAEFGDKPPMEKMEDIQQKATAAASATLTFNAPLIYITNRIVLGTIFRGMPGGLGRAFNRHTRGLGKRIFTNSKVTPAISKAATDVSKKIVYDGGATFLTRMKNLGFKGGLSTAGAFALRYTGANFAEGIQEVTQEVIAKSAEDYYTGLFLDPAATTSDLLDASIHDAIKAQISPQGFEVFMSGFLMGGLVQPVQRLFVEWIPSIYQYGKGTWGSETSKAEYAAYKKKKEGFLEKAIASMNVQAEDPFNYFDPTKLNAIEQKQINERLLQSSYSSDMLSFMDDKRQARYSQLDYLFQTGKAGEFKQLFKDWSTMTEAELIEGFPEHKKDIKSGKFRERIEKMPQTIDEFQKGWEEIVNKYPSPFDASQFIQGSAEYNAEALREIAYNHSVKLAVYAHETFKGALERSNSIYTRLGNDSAISNMSATDLSVLMDLKSLKTEIEMLESEIAIAPLTADQAEKTEKQKKRLKLLTDYLDIITNPENFIKNSKDNIPLAAETEWLETEETGEGIVELGGKKYKASTKVTKEVGTFDRRKINKLAPAFKAYINFLAEQKGEFIQTDDLNEILKDIVDYKFLKGRAQTYFRAIENISNPERLKDISVRISERLKVIYERNKLDTEKRIKKYVADLEKNELINQFASQGVYPESDQVILFFQEGIIPTIFLSEAGNVSPTENVEKWDIIQNQIKVWQRASKTTEVAPGETINEEELQEGEFDRLAKQGEEEVKEISESTNAVLVTKWKSYVQSRVGQSGKVLSWKDWLKTKEAKNIRAIRSELDTLYSSNLSVEEQKQKSFDTWLIENKRTPEVYRILNSKGGAFSDYVVTDSETVQTDKIDEFDVLEEGGSPTGINILKKLVVGKAPGDDEYYWEIVDNNMNNLYEQYKMIDPNGKVITDYYKTLKDAIDAQKMIIGLLPSNSSFGENNEYHYKQILQDNNNEQFVVITTPSTFSKGGKLYLRPLEFANDRTKSFEVKDLSNYKPLDITDIKVTSESDNVLKLRQSEPIKLYAKRQQGESSFDAEVRLSDRLRDIKDLSSFTFKISKNTESWDLYQSEDPSTREQLGVEGFTNPRLRVGAEEITVEVMNGNESIGFLQGPTGAILLDEHNNVINPLSLTEDQVDDYFQIYATKSSLRTKAEQLQIIKNNYASSILLNEKLKQLLGGDAEAIININSIKGLELRVSAGKMMFAQKDKGATFSELYSNTVDGTNIWVVDNRSDGKGGVITNITEDEVYERTEAIVDAASNQSGYNPLETKSRYVAVTRLPNGTFTFVELKASELSAMESNQMVVDILNTQDKTLAENIDEENDEVKDETANFAFNEKLKDDFYIFGKSGEFIDIELTARGDVQVIYRNTRKEGVDGKALRIAYTINENELKSVKESKNNFTEFLTVLNNKIKFKDSGLEVKSGLVLKADNFRKSIPKEATIKDLASVITNFEAGLRKNIRVEAVITDSAQINNVINNAELPTYVKNNVEEQIENTDKVIMENEIESPELTPEYMIKLHKGGFTNVENSTLKLIARKLATDLPLSNAERTIYTNTKNTNIRDSINLLKLTYKSGVIEEGGTTDVDTSTVITEKSPTRKTADKIKELQDKYDELEDKIWDDTFNEINEGNPEKTAGDAQITIKANEAADNAIENSEELKALDAEIEALKKKLAPKVINENLGDAHIEKIDTFITWAKDNLPDFIQIQDIQDLSARLKANGITAGMFALSLNSIKNFSAVLTPGMPQRHALEGDIYIGEETPFKYHEAFHSVFRMLLSEAEIKKYLKLAKKEKLAALRKEGKKLSEALNELRSSHSVYNKLSNTELEHRLYEEYLADKFDEFKMNPKGTKTSSEIKSLFTRIIEWIKAVINKFSKNELTTLFENIDSGKYARSTVQENRFTNETLTEGITSAAPKVIPVDTIEHIYNDPFTGQEIVSLSNVYMSANDQRKMIATIAALYRSYVERGDLLIMSKKAILDTAILDYTKLLNPKREYYKSEISGISFRSIRKKLKTYHKALKTNSDIIAENVRNYLSIFDSKFQIEQDAFEEHQHNENNNVRKIDEYGKSANQIGGAMSLSTELRTFIATTVLEEQDLFGNKETLEGVPIVTTVDFNFGYNGLVKALANKTTDLQLLQALALFSSSNKNTAAVADNIFKEIGIADPISLLDAQQLPKISNPEFLQKVIKAFNMMNVDYMFAHKDEDTKIVFIYAANKKDDGNTQIDQWSQHFDQVYPTLQSKEGKKKANTLLNLLNSKIQNPKERSRNDLDKETKEISKKIYDQIGIQLNPATIKYSILSNKVIRKNWEEAFVSLGLAAGVDPITVDDFNQLRLSIGRGENIFLDNQTNIPVNEADEQNTPEEIDSSTGISSRLKMMAKTNAHFDETIGSTVFRDSKGNLIYSAQMPTFHLVKVAEMSEKNWVETKIKENAFFNRNYLLNNAKFKAHAASGKLKVSRFIGSKEGRLTENEFGSIVENRGLHINQQEGVSFGESSGAEFIADVINAYVYKYNRNSQTVPLNPYVNDNGKDLFYITSPVDIKVLSDASSSDFISLPIEKMVEKDENGDIKLTEHTTDALINNILQAEYERVARELDPNTADTDIIEGFNTDDIKKGVQLGQRGKRFVRSRGFITSRKSKIKVIGGIKTPLMSKQTKDDIISRDQRIILRGGKAYAAIGLNSGQESPVIMDFKVDDQLKSESFVLKNKGLISVDNINIDQYIKDLGNAVSKKPIAGKKKQNIAKIGEVKFYFQRGDDAKFFNGDIEQYVYEFIPLEEAGIEIGVEEVKTVAPVKKTAKTKEGVDFIFEQTPELAGIGTSEQYSAYLDSLFPKSQEKDILWHMSKDMFDKYDPKLMKSGYKDLGTTLNLGRTRGHWLEHAYEVWIDQISRMEHEEMIKYDKILNEIEKHKVGSKEREDLLLKQINTLAFIINIKNPYKSKDFFSDSQDTGNAPAFRKKIQKEYDSIIDEAMGGQIAIFEDKNYLRLGSQEDIEGFKSFVKQPQATTELDVAYFESDTFVEETLIGAAKEGLSFDDAVKRIGEEKLKEIIEKRIFTDFFDFRRLLNNKKATNKISVEISEGLGMIVRPEKGKRGKAYHQVTTKGREAMKLYNLKENDLDFNLAQIYMNQYINARSFNDILLGDHSYLFENFTAETKRAKMQNAAGPSTASALIATKLGINHTFMSDNSISLITYHDPKAAKRFGNGTIDPTDAQMVGTIKAFRHFWFGIGQLSIEQSELLDKIDRGETITSDEMWGNVALGTEGYIKLNAIINSKKFVYGDGRVNLKMSFFVLTKQLTSYKDKFGQWKALPQMEELHNLRVKLEEIEKGKETVGIAIPTSGSKMMKKNVITAEEMYGSQSIAEIQENNKDRNGGNRNVIQGLNPKWMRLQVVNPSNKIWGIDPRQMKQLITTEQDDKLEVMIDGKPVPLKKIKEAYHKSISDQVTLRYRNKRNLIFNMDTALDEIGNSIDAGKVTVNLRSFLRYAMAGLQASQAKTQMLEFFSFDEIGNPKFDLNNPITVDKFQELFLSYFSKGVLAGEQASISAALVSSYGVKPMRIVKKLDENDQPIETEVIRMEAWKAMKYKPEIADKFIEGKNGEPGKWVDLKVNDVILQKLQHNVYDPESNTYYSEFMIAPHHRDILKFIKPGDIIPAAVAKAFGIRIPSQDKHSSISLRLVDFLPEFYGSSAMFADELIEISGADFDIDKLYMHIKEWFYSKGKFNEYGKATTEKGRYAEYIRYTLSQVNKKGSAVNEAVINWSTNDSAFLDEEGVEDIQDELARQTAADLVVNANLFKEAYKAKVIAYILEINDNITDEQVIKLYNKNEDLYGALQSLSLPVTFTEYKAYVKKHKVEPYEAAINNDILDQRVALVANEGIINPKGGRLVGIGNEPADLEVLYEIRDYLKEEFPELADFANPEDIDPDNMLGLLETWESIKTGEGGIGAAVRPNVVLNMLGENGIEVLNKIVGGKEVYPQIRFNKTTFNTFATPYSKDGKSNDKATRTQYLVSALITMMTDNAKERLADLLSINKNSLAVVSTLSSLGVPIKTSMLLLKNPVIKLGYDLAINKLTPMSPGINAILKKRIKFLNENFKISTESVTDQVLINAINNDWVDTTLPLTSGFGKKMTGQTPKGYTDEQASAEYAILRQFVNARRLTDYTGKLGSLVDLLAGFGRSSEDIERRIDDFKELGVGLNNEEFSKLKDDDGIPIPIDVRPIFKGNDFRATYYKIFKEFTEDLLPAVFMTRTSDFIKIKEVTLRNMVRNKILVDPKRKAVIEKDILSYLTTLSYKQFLLNSPNGIERLGSLQNGLIYDDIGGKDVITIEHVVNSIRNYFTSQDKENYFIEKFVNLNLATSEISKAGINRLEANNWTKMSEAKVVDLQASFAEIYSEPALRNYAYDLVHYLLVKDGMQFKSNTFLNVVPAFMFDQVLRSISAGHALFKSSTKTDSSYDLVFGKTPTELANDFTEGYLKSQQNNWLLPVIKYVTNDETKAAHIDKDGNLRLKQFNGVASYINKKGEKVIKGRKLKIEKEGKKYFINTKTEAYKQLSQNISELSDHGITFNPIVENGVTIYEMNLPLYLRNEYKDNFGGVHIKTFELNQTYREKRFSKSGDIMNMLDGEDLIARGWEAVYTPVETVGSNQSTAIAFALGEVPEYQALRAKYQTDPIDALIKDLDIESLSNELSKIDLSAVALQDIYNQAVATGAAVKTTDKGVMINGKSITTSTEVKDPTEDFDYNIEDLSPDVLKDQIKGTQLLLDLYAKKNEESPKSDIEIKVIRDWWNDPKTDRYGAQKYTKRSGIDGILKEFDTFDGTAERYIEIIENCK